MNSLNSLNDDKTMVVPVRLRVDGSDETSFFTTARIDHLNDVIATLRRWGTSVGTEYSGQFIVPDDGCPYFEILISDEES